MQDRIAKEILDAFSRRNHQISEANYECDRVMGNIEAELSDSKSDDVPFAEIENVFKISDRKLIWYGLGTIENGIVENT